jgi:hypothetical protein
MEGLKKLLTEKFGGKVNVKTTGKRWSHSPAHELAAEISRAYGEPGRFGSYLGMIRRMGLEEARRIYREIEAEPGRDKRKLFFYRGMKKVA